jgi:hypothetical protein
MEIANAARLSSLVSPVAQADADAIKSKVQTPPTTAADRRVRFLGASVRAATVRNLFREEMAEELIAVVEE